MLRAPILPIWRRSWGLEIVVPAEAGTRYAAAYREDTEYWVPGLTPSRVEETLMALARDDGLLI